MNQESLIELVSFSQAGDAKALEELLLWAYTPVSFLCKKLLLDANTAETQTREILRIISKKMKTLQDPSLFDKWVVRLTIARCLQVLPDLKWMSEGEDFREEELPIAGENLDQAQTMNAIQKMVDMLPEEPRVCIILLCCGDMHSNGIAEATKYSVDAVHKNMATAQSFVVSQIEKYQNMGTQFYPIDSLKEVLQNAMYQQQEDDAAVALVYGVLGKAVPVPVDPDRGKKILLRVLLVLLVFVILILAGLNIWMRKRNTISPEDYTPAEVSIPTMATEPEETTPSTIAETTEAATEPEETEETTAETKPQAKKENTKPTEETKADATEPETTEAATEPEETEGTTAETEFQDKEENAKPTEETKADDTEASA